MSQRRRTSPKYRHYQPKDLGVVRIDGKNHYLGRYDSPESWEKYHRLVAEWLSRGQTVGFDAAASAKPNDSISINEMLLAYWQFAETYYCKDGEPTKELECTKEAIWPLRQLYGTTKAVDFGPPSLKAVRRHMIGEQKLCRNVANRRVGRVQRVFKWAVAEELVPPSTYHGLQALVGLRFGRTGARETEPVKPVDDQHVDAVQPFVTPHVSAMIQVQRLTGMRPDDVVSMRPCDIDQSGDVWMYERRDHKNRWWGHRRLSPLGPKAQAVLMKGDFDVGEIEGLTIASHDNKVSAVKTFIKSLQRLPAGRKRLKELRRQQFDEFQPDCVITDFEPLTAYLADYYDLPLISIANQHRMRYIEYDCPPGMKVDRRVSKTIIRAMVPQPDVCLVATFFFGQTKNDRTFLFPPTWDATSSRNSRHAVRRFWST